MLSDLFCTFQLGGILLGIALGAGAAAIVGGLVYCTGRTPFKNFLIALAISLVILLLIPVLGRLFLAWDSYIRLILN